MLDEVPRSARDNSARRKSVFVVMYAADQMSTELCHDHVLSLHIDLLYVLGLERRSPDDKGVKNDAD